MKKENITIISAADGLPLSGLLSVPDSPVGIVQIAHGMAEHKERYYPFMEQLAELGFASCIIDHRGHGESVRSGDDLGYFYDDKGEAIVEDCHQVSLMLKERFPDLPLTLFGHSMGSFVVRCVVRKYDADYDKLIVCGSPSANPAAGVAILIADLIKVFKGEHYRPALLTNLSTGAYSKAYPEGGNSWLSVNKQNVIDYDNDPLCGFPFTVNGYRNLFCLMKDCYDKKGWAMKNKDLPIFFISGKGDPCMETLEKWHAAIQFMIDRGYSDVTGQAYEGLRHEILNEGEPRVFGDIIDFLKR